MTRRTLLAVVAVILVLGVADRATAAPLDLPRMGDVTVLIDTITVDGTPPVGANPTSQLTGFCKFQNLNISGLTAYFYAVEPGIIAGACGSTSTASGFTFIHYSSANGTLYPDDGTFQLELNWRVEVRSPLNPDLTRELKATISGVLNASGFVEADASYEYQEFQGTSPVPEIAYSGTVRIRVNLALVQTIEADVTIDHIEVVQTVQDAAGTVPLVRGNETYARVFVKAPKPVQGVEVELTATANGVSLPGTATQDNFTIAVPNPSRENGSHSANLELPDAWTSQPAITLTATIVEVGRGFTDPDTSNNEAPPKLVVFDAMRTAHVSRVEVCFGDSKANALCPTINPRVHDVLFEELGPVSTDTWKYDQLPIGQLLYTRSVSGANAGAEFERFAINLELLSTFLSLQTGGDLFDQLILWLPDVSGRNFRRYRTDNVQWGKRGSLSWAMTSAEAHDTQAFAHLIAYGYGMGVATGSGDCAYPSSPALAGWPYSDARMNDVGFSVSEESVVHSRWDLSAEPFCEGSDPQPWVSPFTYKALHQALKDTGGPPALRGPVVPMALITGTALADGTSGVLNPLYSLTAGAELATESVASGSHCLAVFDGAIELNRTCFNLNLLDIETGEELDRSGFGIAMAVPASYTALKLFAGNTELDALTLTPNAPTLQVESPDGGGVLFGEQTISWTGNDLDGDALTYSVFYSPDDGDSWYPLGIDLDGTELEVNVDDLAEGAGVLFKVMATDGLNTSTVDSAPVTIVALRSGDVTCDGAVTVEDAVGVQRMVAGIGADVPCQPAADVDCDDIESANDVVAILRKLTGLPVNLPQGCTPIGEK